MSSRAPGASSMGKKSGLPFASTEGPAVAVVVAVMVARGSERSLQSRIGLSVFFLIERPITATLAVPSGSST